MIKRNLIYWLGSENTDNMFILAKTTNHFYIYIFFFWFTYGQKRRRNKDQKDGNLGPDGKREDEKKKMKMA